MSGLMGTTSLMEVSVPGRICLFGEHQDYLGLPVIAAAVDLRVTLKASANAAHQFLNVAMPDIGASQRFNPNEENAYEHDRDYLRSAANVLRRAGYSWSEGADVIIRSTIPINSGASSSSALQVAWVSLLLHLAGDGETAENPAAVARYAYLSEVVEFASPGGMMDHFSTACGGVIWLDTREPFQVEPLASWLGDFVLVDSGIPKDTNGVLGRTRRSIENLGIDFSTVMAGDGSEVMNGCNPVDFDHQRLLAGTMMNAALTRKALLLLRGPENHEELGRLLTRHHATLTEKIGVSHPRVDELIQAGLRAGALGGKINGSGCGGSFFLYCPADPERVLDVYRDLGMRAWKVSVDSGLSSSVDFRKGARP